MENETKTYIVKKYGASLYVPLTIFFRMLHLGQGDAVDIMHKDGIIIIKRAKNKID